MYTSIQLAQSLLNDYGITFIGTLRKNKRQIPKEVLPDSKRDIFPSLYGFADDLTLVLYVPQKNKAVLLVSSMHPDNSINPLTNESKKPSLITFYNSTKSGVNIVDQLCRNYTVQRKTSRWLMVIFYSILNVTRINTFIILRNKNHYSFRRDALKQLAMELVLDHLKRRASIKVLASDLSASIKKLIDIISKLELQPSAATNATITVASTSFSGGRKRCYLCGWKKDRKVSMDVLNVLNLFVKITVCFCAMCASRQTFVVF